MRWPLSGVWMGVEIGSRLLWGFVCDFLDGVVFPSASFSVRCFLFFDFGRENFWESDGGI